MRADAPMVVGQTVSSTTQRLGDWSRLAAAATGVGLATLAVSIAGLARDQLLAARFGVGAQLDTFFIALLVPTTVGALAASAVPSALVPEYLRQRSQGGLATAAALTAGLLRRVGTILVVVTIATVAALPVLIPSLASGLSPVAASEAARLSVLLAPTILLSGVAATWIAVLQSEGVFLASSLPAALVPLATVLGVLLARGGGITSATVGLVVGTILQLCVLALMLRKRGVALRAPTEPDRAALQRVTRQLGPMLGVGVLMGSSPFIDQAMASRLDPGSVSSLAYGGKLVGLVASLVIVSIGAVLLPHLSGLVGTQDWHRIRATIRSSVLWLAIGSLAISLFIVLASDIIVRALFERGAFDAAATAAVGRVQRLFALQIPFFAVGILFVRLLSALQRNDVLARGAAINVVAKVGLNLLLMGPLGAAGIALSTSLMYVISCGYLAWQVKRAMASAEQATMTAAAAAPA